MTHLTFEQIDTAKQVGPVQIADGTWLYTLNDLLEEQAQWDEFQPLKGFDFSFAPMWIITDTNSIKPVYAE